MQNENGVWQIRETKQHFLSCGCLPKLLVTVEEILVRGSSFLQDLSLAVSRQDSANYSDRNGCHSNVEAFLVAC